jgi:lipopolysaccharide biosynthesis glycosyltransferase
MERMAKEAVELARKRCSVGTLFRLLIPDVLPLDKVIYLDCDIVVNMDILELWSIPLEDRSLAGALDRPAEKPYGRFTPKAVRVEIMGCDRKTYINAGVLLMNLSRIREKVTLIRQSVPWFKRYRHCSDSSDQDLLNSCFRGDIKIIEGKFNNRSTHSNSPLCGDRHGDDTHSILHATCSPKPWEALRSSTADRLYWKAFLKTPWGRLSPEEIVTLMLDVSEKSTITHRRTSQCYGRIFLRLKKDILWNDVTRVIWLWSKELHYRAKSLFPRRRPKKT